MQVQHFRATGDHVTVKCFDWTPAAPRAVLAATHDHFGGRPVAPGRLMFQERIAAPMTKTSVLGAFSLQNKVVSTAVESNDFFVSRGLGEYCNMFTPVATPSALLDPRAEDPFPTKNFRELYQVAPMAETQLFQHLMSLSPDQVWLDAGAGYALAQRMYRARGGQAKLVAASLVRPSAGQSGYVSKEEDEALAAFQAKDPGFRYVEGRIQDRVVKEKIGLGKVDVITDMIGAFAYSSPTPTLQSFADLLAPGGRLYLHVGSKSMSVQLKDGRTVALADWLASVPGFELQQRTIIEPLGRTPSESLVLVRTSAPCVVPLLAIKNIEADHLPPTLTLAEV